MNRATRINVAVMGVWMGLAGIEHGIGELLQGNVAPEGVMIRSWPDSAFFQSLNGEPAMTIVPNLLLTGILAVIFSLLFVVWSVCFAHLKRGGLGMMLLAIPMLLFGGGIFPPFLGFLIGVAASRMPGEIHRGQVTGLGNLAGKGWPWIFAACCGAWLSLFPGVAVMGYFWGIDDPGFLMAMIAAAFVLLGFSLWSSVQYDRLELPAYENPQVSEVGRS